MMSKFPVKNGPLAHRRVGFSLIEVVIAVIVLSIAVPPVLSMLDSASGGRTDAINTTRATLMATCVLEMVMGDLSSSAPGLGFEALSDPDAYLETPTTGLRDRLAPIVDVYTDAGFAWELDIGEPVNADGTVSADQDENIFRLVRVRIIYPSSTNAAFELPVSIMVSAL